MTKSLSPTGLGFFGAVIASISHEIKNRIAIINEQVLLIKDLAQASVHGREIAPDQFVNLADSVKTEIDSTDTIIKNMNKFAHSTDNLTNRTDLNEVTNLTAALYKRIAGRRTAELAVHPPPTPVVVNTIPFFLMNLIWVCLNAVLEGIGKNRTIHLGCEKTPDGATVWLCVEPIENDMDDAVLQEATADLAAGLGAKVSFLSEKSLVRILLPADIDAI